MIKILIDLINNHPRSFFNAMLSKKHVAEYAALVDFVHRETLFIDYECNFSTRCKYVVDGRHSLYACHNCGKPIRKNIPATSRQTVFWCSAKCQGEDPYMKSKISGKTSHRKTEAAKAGLPPEREIVYHGSPIRYDTVKDTKLRELFESHRKQFKFWLEKDTDLHRYFLEVTYPINFTNLGFGTRLYWIFHRMQEFPKCAACGRQLDFKDVKPSEEWPVVCSAECRKEYVAKLTEQRHRNAIYDKILGQTEVEPLFTREFYVERGQDFSEYPVKCLKCGYKFTSPVNTNYFYRDSKRKCMFRCPLCHPCKKYRSKKEKDLFAYVLDVLGYADAVCSWHNAIWPYELDIYVPSKKAAIEFNGILWHSIEHGVSLDYHLKKTELCEKVGIRLMHVWEDEWDRLNAEVKASVKSFLDGTYHVEIDGGEFVDRSKFNIVAVADKGYDVVGYVRPETVLRSPATTWRFMSRTVGNCWLRRNDFVDCNLMF